MNTIGITFFGQQAQIVEVKQRVVGRTGTG